MGGRDRGFSGRVLSPGGGVRPGLGFSPRTLRPSDIAVGAKNRTPPRPDTPTRHHPPEMPMRLTLFQLKRRATHARQSDVSRQRLRSWRLQQRWSKLKRHEADNNHGSSFGRKLPANAQSHEASKGSAQRVRPPEAMEKKGRGCPSSAAASSFRPGNNLGRPQSQRRKPSKQEGHPRPFYATVSSKQEGHPRPFYATVSSKQEGHPRPLPYATASRSSSMSFNCSSTQSPGLREKIISFRCCARSLRSSAPMVSAR